MRLPKPSRLMPSVLVPLLVLAALGGCGKKKSTDELIGDLKGGPGDRSVNRRAQLARRKR